IVGAAIEDLTALLGLTHHQIAAALWAERAGLIDNLLFEGAFREARTGDKRTKAPAANHQRTATVRAEFVNLLNRFLHFGHVQFSLVQRLPELIIEASQELGPFLLALLNRIRLLFHTH